MDCQERTEYFCVGSVKAEKASGVGREGEARKASQSCLGFLLLTGRGRRVISTGSTDLKDMKEVFWPPMMKTSA